jgi:hypothetical protein
MSFVQFIQIQFKTTQIYLYFLRQAGSMHVLMETGLLASEDDNVVLFKIYLHPGPHEGCLLL